MCGAASTTNATSSKPKAAGSPFSTTTTTDGATSIGPPALASPPNGPQEKRQLHIFTQLIAMAPLLTSPTNRDSRVPAGKPGCASAITTMTAGTISSAVYG